MTATYKGTPKGGAPALLRSYDSRKEPSPEYDCKIWEAGRATSATGLAFKPIQIGQSVFIDEGAGQYNPAPYCLDEATVNEWPGRDVGVFISIGTGKRPSGSDHNQHMWYEGFMGEYAEARKRLISKIEGCERTHQYMKEEHLSKRGVNIGNYYRLNVEIGVGEFGMNEWNRLADISTGTRRYLGKGEVQQMNIEAAVKLAKINRAIQRANGHMRVPSMGNRGESYKDLPDVPEANPLAVELPAEVPPMTPLSADAWTPPPRASYESGHNDNLEIAPLSNIKNDTLSPDSYSDHQSPHSSPSPRPSDHGDRFTVNSPTPNQYRTASGSDKIAIMSLDEYPRPEIRISNPPPRNPRRVSGPPPVPPKTPINGERSDGMLRRPIGSGNAPPYPLEDGPPPVANMARKPPGYGR